MVEGSRDQLARSALSGAALLTNEEVESHPADRRHWGGARGKSWAGMSGGRLIFPTTKSLLSPGINTEVPEEQPPRPRVARCAASAASGHRAPRTLYSRLGRPIPARAGRRAREGPGRASVVALRRAHRPARGSPFWK